jgi:hypothetical protein
MSGGYMADFFEKPDDETPEDVSTKIKIGEQEYDPEEAQRLIELGRIGAEAEEKFNTKIDKVWPEYTKSQNELKSARENLSKYEQELAELRKANEAPSTLTPEVKEQARKQLLEIMGGEVVTKADLENYYAERKATDNLLDQTKSFEKEIDGSDGRPPFNTMEVLKYMEETGIRNPMKAYKDKYETELDSWKEKQLTNKKTPFITNSNPSADKQPPRVKTTRDNLYAQVEEMLQGNE